MAIGIIRGGDRISSGRPLSRNFALWNLEQADVLKHKNQPALDYFKSNYRNQDGDIDFYFSNNSRIGVKRRVVLSNFLILLSNIPYCSCGFLAYGANEEAWELDRVAIVSA